MQRIVKPKFNIAFHGLRGLAAFMIFFIHSMNGYIEHVCPDCSSRFTEIISNIGVFGVEIFFFLSGFVIYSASIRTAPKDFFLHRFWRIYPVFILFTLLYFIMNHFIQVVPEKDNIFYLMFNMIFINVFTGTPSLTPNAWTVVLEIWYYVATFFIVNSWINKKGNFLMLIGILLAAYLIVYWPITLYYIIGVIASIFISKYLIFIQRLTKLTINSIQLISLIIMLTIIIKGHDYYTWSMIISNFNVLLLLMTLFIVMILMFHEDSFLALILSNEIFLILGTVSYTLYLAHPYSYIISRKIIEYFFSTDYLIEISIIFFIFLLFSLTFSLVWFVHYLFEAKIYKKMTGKELLIPTTKI